MACRNTKAAICSLTRPICESCHSKGIICSYPEKATKYTMLTAMEEGPAQMSKLTRITDDAATQSSHAVRGSEGLCFGGIVLIYLSDRQISSPSTPSELEHVITSNLVTDPALRLSLLKQSPPSYVHTASLVDVPTNRESVILLIETYWRLVHEFIPVFPERVGRDFLTQYFTHTQSSPLLEDHGEPVVKAMLFALCALGSRALEREIPASAYFRHAQDQIRLPTCKGNPIEYIAASTLMVCLLGNPFQILVMIT